jgi:hypothetical protein
VSKPELLQTERDHQKRAFELYYSLGTRRSYRQIAEQLHVSLSTVKLWSRSFYWRNRVAERDAEAARQIVDRPPPASSGSVEQNTKIVRMAMVRLAKAIADGRVRMTMADLDRLIKLDRYLNGDPASALDYVDGMGSCRDVAGRLLAIFATYRTEMEERTDPPHSPNGSKKLPESAPETVPGRMENGGKHQVSQGDVTAHDTAS